MNIKRVEGSDIDALKLISEKALRESVDAEKSEIEEFVIHTANNIDTHINDKKCIFLKSVSGNIVIGYILVKEYWNLSDLFVLPGHQRFGVGTLLLSNAIEISKKHGVGYMHLNSAVSAVGFYTKFGFITSKSHASKHINTVALEIKF